MLVGFFLVGLLACEGPASEALGPSASGEGPQIVYDPLRRPNPEIPLPNNTATRLDDTSPTGRRLNTSVVSPLAKERLLRTQINRLDGFSVTAPIRVSFDAPLDLNTVNHETIRLIDVTRDSPTFGKVAPLDIGEGSYPVAFKSREVFPYEENSHLPDLIFAEGNTVDGEAVYHWEVETNTLLVKPLFPLRPATTYAVILTTDITGLNGDAIRSPFENVHHLSQKDALKPLKELLENGFDDVAFAWTFTTRTVADPLIHIRDGLDGKGPLAFLRDAHTYGFKDISNMGIDHDGDGSVEGLPDDPRDHRFTLKPLFIPMTLSVLGDVAQGLGDLTFDHLDYVVFGNLASVDLRSEEDHAIWVNAHEQTVDHHASEVPFIISVPKTTELHQPPFPVLIYNHGARSSRLEQILVADDMARAGFAMVGIDAVGHGPFGGDLRVLLEREAGDFPPELVALIAGVVAESFFGQSYDAAGKDLNTILTELETHGLWRALFVDGRSEDLDGDGVLLGGDGYFVPNPFELASNAVQTVVDNLVLVRILQSLSSDNLPEQPLDDPRNASDQELMAYLLAGDFNADGVLDIGGAENAYYALGTSLGGIHTSVFAAIEPSLRAVAPIVSGGGMTDIMIRTDLSEAVDAVLAEPLGPAVVGCPLQEDTNIPAEEVVLSWNNWSLKCRDSISILLAEANSDLPRAPVVPGGSAELVNPRVLEEGGADYADSALHISPIHEDGGFSVTVAADVGDILVLTLRDSNGDEVFTSEFSAKRAGLGRLRNSPELRRLVDTAQHAMDAGDPLAYARHLIRDPLPGVPPRNVLHLADVGDTTVPFSTMLSWDRAVGLFGLDEETALEVNQAFLDHDAVIPKKPFWDPDDLDQSGDGIGPLPPIETTSGVSAVRFPHTGDHEYIALPDEEDDFNWAAYSRNQIIHFFLSDGQDISDDLCLEDGSCAYLP